MAQRRIDPFGGLKSTFCLQQSDLQGCTAMVPFLTGDRGGQAVGFIRNGGADELSAVCRSPSGPNKFDVEGH
jgi:hypothetical protein